MGGYSAGAPWHFKGKALYQLSLVRVDEAKKYVPPELPLVNLFGWTLGGFYLARYSHSPVGPFEEMVALAGLAWNFPTSCAWAARVYVNNREARDHGISEVGLPSRLASFRAVPLPQLKARLPAGQPQPVAGSDAAVASSSAGVHGSSSIGSGSFGGGSSSSSSGHGVHAGTSSSDGSHSSNGGSALTHHDTILDRTLAKFEKTNRSWWDHHYHQHNWFRANSSTPGRSDRQRRAGAGDSSSSSGSHGSSTSSSSSSSGSRSTSADRTAAAGDELGPGTWAVELRNEERQRRGGLLAAIFARGRGGKQGPPCRGLVSGPVCRVELPPQPKGQGPRVSMCLPSFSGATPDYPGFLQYNLRLQANIRPVPPARLAFPPNRPKQDQDSSEVLDMVLGGRPLLCLEFGNMEMEVQAPAPWYPRTSKAQAPWQLRTL